MVGDSGVALVCIFVVACAEFNGLKQEGLILSI